MLHICNKRQRMCKPVNRKWMEEDVMTWMKKRYSGLKNCRHWQNAV